MIEHGLQLPIYDNCDVREWVMQLSVQGNHLSEDKLLKIWKMLQDSLQLHKLLHNDESIEKWPALSSSFADTPYLPEIITKIAAIITPNAMVKDTASPQLAVIRRNIQTATSSMSGAMRRVIEKGISTGVLSADVAPAIRDGRLVIPIGAAERKNIQGIVHGQSATGKTFFIEPAEVVEANNRIRELKMQERKEIISILTALADFMRPFAQDIERVSYELGRFDFIHAKALLAGELNAQMPHIDTKPALEWYNAIHPILFFSHKRQNRSVVPLDITLNSKNRILVISGPNAGGKSVTLKTVAIVQYMFQCGLMPPLYSNSHMGVFRNMFIDIGDEQSMENDLSTYSSHLKNMKFFLSHANANTLFLADEMGSGTEPQIGGAIAQSIIAQLNGVRAFGVITTHYQNLKTFANAEDGLINGAMLYDRQHLQPLFQLALGSPGSSFALEIARKSGLPLNIIDNAKNIVGSDYVNIDKYILDLTRDKKYWAGKRLSVKEKENKIDALLQQLQFKADEIKEKRADIIRQARKEAAEILQTANARIENAVKEIRTAEAEKEKTKSVRSELEDYKRKLESQNNKIGEDPKELRLDQFVRKSKHKKNTPKENTAKSRAELKPLSIGDYVKTENSNTIGKIISIKGNKAEVAFGAIRSFMNLDRLTIASQPKQQSISSALSSISSSTIESSRKRQLEFKTEIDLRGFRVDEALQAVTYFLDDAIQFGVNRVRILHGTGTGALKTSIRQLLQTNTAVESFHDEDVRFGGAGITIVNLQ